jgi:hypothetical protein
LALLGGRGYAEAGGGPASEYLPELPELDQAGAGIVTEVPLGLTAESDQERVVGGEEAEVR